MKTSILAVSSAAALLFLSAPANAGGAPEVFESVLEALGILREPVLPEVLRRPVVERPVPNPESPVYRDPERPAYLPGTIPKTNPLLPNSDAFWRANEMANEIRNATPIRHRLQFPELNVSRTNVDAAIRIDAEIGAARQVAEQAHLTDAESAVSSFYKNATQQIVTELDASLDAASLKSTGELSQKQVEDIINAAVSKAISSAAKENESGITFELLTGKLTADWSFKIHDVTVTAGEVNIYKITAVVTGAVLACKAADKALNRSKFNECVEAVLAKVGSIVAQEMNSEPADSAKALANPK